MTREEIIARLEGMKGNGYKEQEQAIDEAIETLVRIKYVQETIDCILNTCKSNKIADIAMRNVAKLVQDAIGRECPDFEKIPKAQPYEDAVSREAVLQGMYDLCDTGETLKENPWRDNPHIDAIIDTIENLPPVTPKQRTGKWIKTSKAVMGEGYLWYCDKCGHQVYQDTSRPYPSEKYCPNCGDAKMEGESE